VNAPLRHGGSHLMSVATEEALHAFVGAVDAELGASGLPPQDRMWLMVNLLFTPVVKLLGPNMPDDDAKRARAIEAACRLLRAALEQEHAIQAGTPPGTVVS
jgi:hypothetical protein